MLSSAFSIAGLETIRKNLEREVAKEKITAEARDAAIARITPTVDRMRLAACDFVVEAASERFEIKSELFRDLDQLCRPEVILSSNTSSISITKLAAVDQAAGQSHRYALLQSSADDEAGGGDSRAGDLGRDLRHGKVARREAGQDAGRGQRRAGLRF